ncbi:hypothetical protein CCACVL1_19772 [Corchorus capsularis]|uniref:Uncharacterized protein n=1 Tax=Corchorus capsularis TaxID=210143 RepID=A0A1R3HEW4_COCAP|nr:hypothetical protein CCACVL1_19772 [Corchorus capsularis]
MEQNVLSWNNGFEIWSSKPIVNSTAVRFADDKTPMLLIGPEDGEGNGAKEVSIDRLIYFNPTNIKNSAKLNDQGSYCKDNCNCLGATDTIMFQEIDKYKLPPTAKDTTKEEYVFTLGMTVSATSEGSESVGDQEVLKSTPRKMRQCFPLNK